MYRTIDCAFWTDDKVRALPAFERLLFFYLITNPHSHYSGLYYLPKATMQYEVPLGRAFDRTFDALALAHFLEWDSRLDYVWVRNMLEHQGRGQKLDKGAASHLVTLHHSPLIPAFLERYPSVKVYCSDTLSIPYQYPIDTPPPPHSPSDSLGLGPGLSSSSSLKEGKECEKGEFDQFWNCYPKKVGKIDARKAFDRAKERPAIEVMLTAIHKAVISAQWTRDDGRFIPNPATWLNQGRWDDQAPPKPTTTTDAFLARKDTPHEPTRLRARLAPPDHTTMGEGIPDDDDHGRGAKSR